MQSTLQDRDWTLLLRRIKDGKCTPFLGAGSCAGLLPLGRDIAEDWAREYNYPLRDNGDLARVSQYLAVQYDPMFPKEEILKYFENIPSPEFNESDEPHGILADLPLPVYITTNYDKFMLDALKSRNKDPKRELCRWNEYVKDHTSVFDSSPYYSPTPANPVVYYLHGNTDVPESMVLTEDDYLDFLVNVSKESLLPHQIQRALTGSSLLFLGYSLSDWTFKVLHRGLVNATEASLRRISITVQLPPPSADGTSESIESIQSYLNEYFGKTDMKVAWGTAREFCGELRRRWEEFSNDA